MVNEPDPDTATLKVPLSVVTAPKSVPNTCIFAPTNASPSSVVTTPVIEPSCATRESGIKVMRTKESILFIDVPLLFCLFV